jgi:Holliday junction resolvase RusA-like endonuclease
MFIRYAWRELDYDNLVASLKPIADGLTKAGIIKNDSFQTTGRWIVDQTKISKKDVSKIFIRVESA